MRHLWFKQDIKAAVDASRIHHQLLPNKLYYEYGVLQVISMNVVCVSLLIYMIREL